MNTLSLKEVEALFKVFDQSSQLLKDQLATSYLDGFIETGNNLIDGQVQVEDGKPDELSTQTLAKLYQQTNVQAYDAETIRQAVQLTMLKAIKEDKIQANHQLTPDALGLVMGYLLMRLIEKKQGLTLLDPAVGTANLLTTVINQLGQEQKRSLNAVGFDNDDSMLAVADINVTLQKKAVELRHQDAVSDLLISPVDVAISDLPVGYYPLDDRAQKFKTALTTGHSFTHHLLIEQAMQNVKPGGVGIFLVPSQLFATGETKQLLNFLQDTVYLQAFLTLPEDLFTTQQSQKAVLLLQRPGAGAKQADKVMIGAFPSFNKKAEFQKFLAEIIDWEVADLLNVN